MTEILNFLTIEKERWLIEVWATKKFIKDQMTGKVDIVWRIVEKNCKKIKFKFIVPKKSTNIYQRFGTMTSFFTFFSSFLKKAPEYIDPSCHFVLYEILCGDQNLKSNLNPLNTIIGTMSAYSIMKVFCVY